MATVWSVAKHRVVFPRRNGGSAVGGSHSRRHRWRPCGWRDARWHPHRARWVAWADKAERQRLNQRAVLPAGAESHNGWLNPLNRRVHPASPTSKRSRGETSCGMTTPNGKYLTLRRSIAFQLTGDEHPGDILAPSVEHRGPIAAAVRRRASILLLACFPGRCFVPRCPSRGARPVSERLGQIPSHRRCC